MVISHLPWSLASITDNQTTEEELRKDPDNTANEDVIETETGKANDAKPDNFEEDQQSPRC